MEQKYYIGFDPAVPGGDMTATVEFNGREVSAIYYGEELPHCPICQGLSTRKNVKVCSSCQELLREKS